MRCQRADAVEVEVKEERLALRAASDPWSAGQRDVPPIEFDAEAPQRRAGCWATSTWCMRSKRRREARLWAPEDERHANHLLVEAAPVHVATVLAELLAVVRGDDEEGVVEQVCVLELADQRFDGSVGFENLAVVLVDESCSTSVEPSASRARAAAGAAADARRGVVFSPGEPLGLVGIVRIDVVHVEKVGLRELFQEAEGPVVDLHGVELAAAAHLAELLVTASEAELAADVDVGDVGRRAEAGFSARVLRQEGDRRGQRVGPLDRLVDLWR